MASVEDLILKSIDEIKADMKSVKTDLKIVSDEVIKLKTKAAIYGSLAGSVSGIAFFVIKSFFQ